MHLCYCKHSFNVFEDSLLPSAQLSNTKVSFRHSTHSKERCLFLSRESSFNQSLSVFSTDFPLNRVSCNSLKRVPIQPTLFSSVPILPLLHYKKSLLKKCSLAPLIGVTKPTKADYTLWEISCFAVVKVLPESNLVFSSKCSPHSTEPCLIPWNWLPIRAIFLATLCSVFLSPYATCQRSIDIFKCPLLVTHTTVPTYLNLL